MESLRFYEQSSSNKIVCNICNKKIAKSYMTKHKQTYMHVENAYQYYVENQIEEKFILYDNIYD